VTRESPAYNATSNLFLSRFAAAAANHAVVADYLQLDDADEEAIRATLSDLHLRIFGEFDEPHSPEVDETYALFASTLERGGDRKSAWKTTLTAMLEDYRLAYY
jgi:hypothetical protein